MSKFAICVAVLLAMSTLGFADVITSVGTNWILIPASVGPNTGTFGLPASIPGCGDENEPTCEPTGDFINSAPFTTSGFFTMLESPAGDLSDVIVFANSGPGGRGEILLFSDPSLPASLPNLPNRGALCTEDPVTGCTGSFTLTSTTGTTFTVQVASDGEAVFDPFGFGIDTSDQVQFNGVTTFSAPEPSDFLLLGSGLFAVMLFARRRLRAQA